MANTTAAKEQYRLLKQGYAGQATTGTGENARASAYYAVTNDGEVTDPTRSIAEGYVPATAPVVAPADGGVIGVIEPTAP